MPRLPQSVIVRLDRDTQRYERNTRLAQQNVAGRKNKQQRTRKVNHRPSWKEQQFLLANLTY